MLFMDMRILLLEVHDVLVPFYLRRAAGFRKRTTTSTNTTVCFLCPIRFRRRVATDLCTLRTAR